MSMTRIQWIDYAKTFAIFGVVLLHVHCSEALSRYINGFIMPLFFLISGYLFSYSRNPSYGPFIRKRFRQLVVPYLWINAVAYMAWLLFLRHYGPDAGAGTPWHYPLAGVVSGIPPMLVHDIPLWSLLCFFMVELLFYPLNRILRHPLAVASVALALNVCLYFSIPDLLRFFPMALGPATAGIIFYAIGYYIRTLKLEPRQMFDVRTIVAALAVFAVSMYFNEEVTFYICDYSNYALFMLSSLSGSYLVCAAAYYVSLSGTPAIIGFISQTTLLICGFHLLVFALIKGIMLLCFGIDPQELTAGLFRGLLFGVSAFALTLPAAYAVRRYMRFLVDK